jgi:ribose transport system ATP-binding protein
MSTPVVELTNIDKSFFGVPVLRQVSLRVELGSTLGLVGENGAGKSTLMNILGGNLSPDSGQMKLAGMPYAPRSPRDADESGVAFIHQELNLFPNLSIAENLFLTRFPFRFARIDRQAIRRRSAELLEQAGLDVSPNVRVETLSAGERQIVEIAKALSLDARLIILDEPTTSLTSRERDRLFELLLTLQQRGIAMIYISHAIGDVRQLCDNIVILRDGQVADHGPVAEFDTHRIVSRMVGRESDQQFPTGRRQATGDVLLRVHEVSQPGVVHRVTFDVHRGEIVGISGLMGSGRSELARILFGLDPMSMGQIELNGQSLNGLSTRQRIRRGLALLTESRRDDGLCMQASIRENISLVSASRFSSGPIGVIRKRRLLEAVSRIRQDVKMTPSVDDQQPVRILSGGNQQKTVLAKWLLSDPPLLILDEPTRGIDVGARFEIYTLINRLADQGAGILIISSELDELIGMGDRILVMRQGEIRDELDRESFDRHRIMRGSLHSDRASGVSR